MATTIAAHPFAESDQTLDGMTTPTGGFTWAVSLRAGFSIVSNQAKADTNASCGEWLSDMTNVLDVRVTVKYKANRYTGVTGRQTAATTSYLAFQDMVNKHQLYKVVSGSLTQIGSNYTGTISVDDLFGLEITGASDNTTVKYIINGSAVITSAGRNDGIGAGKAGLRGLNNYNGAVDDFLVEDISSGATISLGNLEATASLPAPTLTPGAVTTALGNLEAVAEILDPTITPGGTSIALGNLEALAALNGLALTSDAASVTLGLLESVAELLGPTLTPGATSVSLGSLGAAASLLDLTLTPSSVAVPLGNLEALASMLGPALTSGDTSIALGVLEAVATLNSVGFTALLTETGITIHFSTEGPLVVFPTTKPTVIFSTEDPAAKIVVP